MYDFQITKRQLKKGHPTNQIKGVSDSFCGLVSITNRDLSDWFRQLLDAERERERLFRFEFKRRKLKVRKQWEGAGNDHTLLDFRKTL